MKKSLHDSSKSRHKQHLIAEESILGESTVITKKRSVDAKHGSQTECLMIHIQHKKIYIAVSRLIFITNIIRITSRDHELFNVREKALIGRADVLIVFTIHRYHVHNLEPWDSKFTPRPLRDCLVVQRKTSTHES